jgi:hypothetical protein
MGVILIRRRRTIYASQSIAEVGARLVGAEGDEAER